MDLTNEENNYTRFRKGLMSADAMFEFLGYKLLEASDMFEKYNYYNKKTRYNILLSEKEVSKFIKYWELTENEEDGMGFITMDELDAIDKKTKELKWR